MDKQPTARIGTNEAVGRLRKAGYGVTQLERGTLLIYRGDQSYALTHRETEGGRGYIEEAVDALVSMPRGAARA